MRLLSGVEPPDTGERKVGHNARLGYFGQDRFDLDLDKTVLQNMTEAAPVSLVPRLRTMLGAFLFRDDAVDKRVKVLSGGEKSRLALARMLLRPANLLLLDEPTNHLDLDSKEILLDALDAYQGTLVFVSHDRYFLDKLATKVAEIDAGILVVHPGRLLRLSTGQTARERDPRASEPAERGEAATIRSTNPRQETIRRKTAQAVEKQRKRQQG